MATQDPRGTLLWQYLRFVEYMQPKFFLMENVRGLLSAGVGEVRVRYLGRAPRTGGGTTLQYAGAEDAPRAELSSVGGAYWIQAGAFSDRRAARRAADRLGDRARVDGDRNDGLFRVLVGPWPDLNDAERSRQAVIARGYADALLISAR